MIFTSIILSSLSGFFSVQLYYDVSCVMSKCANEVRQCDQEVDTGNGAKTSYCQAVAYCVQQSEKNDPTADPEAKCLHEARAAPTTSESVLLSCVTKHECAKPVSFAAPIKPEAVPVPVVEKIVPVAKSSFLDLAQTNTNSFYAAEKEAEREEKVAEEAWEKSKKNTDNLLNQVHSEMKTLTEDLNKATTKEREELASLEISRKKENSDLAETEHKLEELARTPILVKSMSASAFLQNNKDIIDPLRKAALDAHQFAERVNKEKEEFMKLNHNTNDFSESFLESGNSKLMSERNMIRMENESNEKADKSLSLAEKALEKLNLDLAEQKKELKQEELEAKKEHDNLVDSHGMSLGDNLPEALSFLQESSVDPLSPQALATWRARFEDQLQKARSAAGIKAPFKSMLMQLDLSDHSSFLESDKIKQDERNVARLQQEYNEQMAKLEQDNAVLKSEAREELEKAKDMKNKLDSDVRAQSLLQTANMPKYDAVAEDEKIRELERKWQHDSLQLRDNTKVDQEAENINKMIEQEKAKEHEAQIELNKRRSLLNKDIEAMKKDVAMINIGNSPTQSFIQKLSTNTENKSDPLNHARELVKQLELIVKGKPQPAGVSFLQTESNVDVALKRAESDLKNLEKQLKEQTFRLREMAKESLKDA